MKYIKITDTNRTELENLKAAAVEQFAARAQWDAHRAELREQIGAIEQEREGLLAKAESGDRNAIRERLAIDEQLAVLNRRAEEADQAFVSGPLLKSFQGVAKSIHDTTRAYFRKLLPMHQGECARLIAPFFHEWESALQCVLHFDSYKALLHECTEHSCGAMKTLDEAELAIRNRLPMVEALLTGEDVWTFSHSPRAR